MRLTKYEVKSLFEFPKISFRLFNPGSIQFALVTAGTSSVRVRVLLPRSSNIFTVNLTLTLTLLKDDYIFQWKPL